TLKMATRIARSGLPASACNPTRAFAMGKILFPAIDLKDGNPHCPQRFTRERMQSNKGICHG
ncbi:MAG: hypothetical protein AAF217_07890, partial [Pseudomonadota bacterium]